MKTKHEIINSHPPNKEYPPYYHESAIEEMMDEYYNQAIDETIERVKTFLTQMPGLYEPLIIQLQSLKKPLNKV